MSFVDKILSSPAISSILSVVGIHESQEHNDTSNPLELLQFKYEKESNVSIKQKVPTSFIHGLPPHIDPSKSILYLKKRDKSELAFYDPIEEKWRVVTSSSFSVGRYGSLLRDLPLNEWPHMSQGKKSNIPLTAATKKSLILKEQMKANGFVSVKDVPIFLLIQWMFKSVSPEMLQKIQHVTLMDIPYEYLKIENFISQDLQKTVTENISEYGRIFPQDLTTIIMNDFHATKNISNTMFLTPYVVTLNHFKKYAPFVLTKESFDVAHPPKLCCKRLQKQVKNYYLASFQEGQSSIMASIEPMQYPESVLYTGDGSAIDSSGYRLGPLTAPTVLSLVNDLTKQLDEERRLRANQETAFILRLQNMENTLRGEYTNADRALEENMNIRSLIDRRFSDLNTRMLFNSQLTHNRQLISAVRSYRNILDNISNLLLSLELPYTDYYLLQVIDQGEYNGIDDPAPLIKTAFSRFTFHELVGLRFLIFSSKELMTHVNDLLNQQRQNPPVPYLETVRNNYPGIYESITAQWPIDVFLRVVYPQDPLISNPDGTPGPFLSRLHRLVIERFGVSDFSFFEKWLNLLFLEKYKNHVLGLYGVSIEVEDFIFPLANIKTQMNALLGNDPSKYHSAYASITNNDNGVFRDIDNVILNAEDTLYVQIPEEDRAPLSMYSSEIQQNNGSISSIRATLTSFIDPSSVYPQLINEMFRKRIDSVFFEDRLWKMSIFITLNTRLSGTKNNFWFALSNSHQAFQLVFRKLFELSVVEHLSEDKLEFFRVIPIDDSKKTSGYDPTDSTGYARHIFEYLINYSISILIRTAVEDFDIDIPVSNKGIIPPQTIQDIIDNIPNFGVEIVNALISFIKNNYEAVSPGLSEEFDSNLIINASHNASLFTTSLDPVINKDWIHTRISLFRTGNEVEDARFYLLLNPNLHNKKEEPAYTSVSGRIFFLTDLYFQGFLLHRDDAYLFKTKSNHDLFLLHDYLYHNALSNTYKSPNDGYVKWREYALDLDGIRDIILKTLYDDLSKNKVFKRLYDVLKLLFGNYLTFLGGDTETSWPYLYVTFKYMINIWIEQRKILEESEKAWRYFIEGDSQLKTKIALFFIPVLSLLFDFETSSQQNAWYDIKHSLWLLDKNVITRMESTGWLLRQKNPQQPELRPDFYMVSQGYDSAMSDDYSPSTSDSTSEFKLTSPILQHLYDYIGRHPTEEKRQILDPLLLNDLNIEVEDYRSTFIDSDTRTHLTRKLNEMKYDIFLNRTWNNFFATAVANLTEWLNNLQDSNDFTHTLRDGVMFSFNIDLSLFPEDFSIERSRGSMLLTFKDDFLPLFENMLRLKNKVFSDFSFEEDDDTVDNIIISFLENLVILSRVSKNVIDELILRITNPSNDHREYLKENARELLGYDNALLSSLSTFYEKIMNSVFANSREMVEKNILFHNIVDDLIRESSDFGTLNLKYALACYDLFLFTFKDFKNTNQTQYSHNTLTEIERIRLLCTTLSELYKSIGSCAVLNDINTKVARYYANYRENELETDIEAFDYDKLFEEELATTERLTAEEKPGFSFTVNSLKSYLDNLSNVDRKFSKRDDVHLFEKIHQLFVVSCESISQYNLQNIIKYWNVEFSLPPVDKSTLRYALLRDYYQRSFVVELFDNARSNSDVIGILDSRETQNKINEAVDSGDYLRAVAIKHVTKIIKDTELSELPLNQWRVLINAEISPVYYFFDNFDINTTRLRQLDVLRPSSSSSSSDDPVKGNLIFTKTEAFISFIVGVNNRFDVGDTMVFSYIIQLISEIFASASGYISYEEDTVSNLLLLRDYLLSDPRESHDGILGLKPRKEDFVSFKFPFISPFSTTSSLKFGSHVQLAQTIIHSVSPFQKQ